jgi:hypothetical protein
VFQVEHQKQINSKNSQLVAHQSERIKQLEERLKKMQALIDAKETNEGSDGVPAPGATKAPPSDQPCQELDRKYDLHDLLREWINKEVRLPLEPKSEEQSATLKSLEAKLLTEVNMLGEGFAATFQVFDPSGLW